MQRAGTSYGLYKAGEGIQDLLGDRFAGSKGLGDIASGAGRGAAIGNMIAPGVGTVGGGAIGGGYSALKNAGQEFGNPFGGGGMDYGSRSQSNLVRDLSGASGMGDPQQAREELIRRGIDPREASRMLAMAERRSRMLPQEDAAESEAYF